MTRALLLVAVLLACGCLTNPRRRPAAEPISAPSDPRAEIVLAQAAPALQEGDLDAARLILDEALRRGVQDGRIHLVLAGIALEEGRMAAAERAVDQACVLLPESAEVELLHGRILEATGRLWDASAAYARAAFKNPDDPVASLARERVLANLAPLGGLDR